MNKKRLVSLLLSLAISASSLTMAIACNAADNVIDVINSTSYTSDVDATVTEVTPKAGNVGNKFLAITDRNNNWTGVAVQFEGSKEKKYTLTFDARADVDIVNLEETKSGPALRVYTGDPVVESGHKAVGGNKTIGAEWTSIKIENIVPQKDGTVTLPVISFGHKYHIYPVDIDNIKVVDSSGNTVVEQSFEGAILGTAETTSVFTDSKGGKVLPYIYKGKVTASFTVEKEETYYEIDVANGKTLDLVINKELKPGTYTYSIKIRNGEFNALTPYVSYGSAAYDNNNIFVAYAKAVTSDKTYGASDRSVTVGHNWTKLEFSFTVREVTTLTKLEIVFDHNVSSHETVKVNLKDASLSYTDSFEADGDEDLIREQWAEPLVWDFSVADMWVVSKTGLITKATYENEAGTFSYDAAEKAIRISGSDDWRGNYRIMPNLSDKTLWSDKYQYMVIKYKTDYDMSIPMILNNNGTGNIVTIEPNTGVANGKWTCTQPFKIGGTEFAERFETGRWFTLALDTKAQDLSLWIKEIVVFCTKEQAYEYYSSDANAFDNDVKTGNSSIAVNGTDIAKYQIVISKDANDEIVSAAQSLCTAIEGKTGAKLPVINDSMPKTDYEIVIGNTRREASDYYYGTNGVYTVNRDKNISYEVAVRNGQLVIAGGMNLATVDAVSQAIAIMGYGLNKTANFTNGFNINSVLHNTSTFSYGDPEKGVVETFTDNFDDEIANTSPNYWIEHALTDYWTVQKDGDNLVYEVNTDAESYSWLHVFERDVEYTAKMKVTEAGDEAVVGMLLRFNEDEAYVRVGYDYRYDEWYISDKQGHDYEIYVHDSYASELRLGEWVTVRAVLNGKNLSVYLNDSKEPTMTASGIHHLSAGRVGFYANDAVVMFDDVNLIQTSGQGKVQEGVVELAFGPHENDVAKGGTALSVFELSDGSLIMQGANLISHDNGITWSPLTDWGKNKATNVVANVFRLQSGKLINLAKATIDGTVYHIAQYSEDEGKTWHDGGVIAPVNYNGLTSISGSNIIDRFTQMSDGRIFVSQNYSGTLPKGDPNEYATVFVEIYYSDDDGMTWTKSENDSFDINVEKYARFGESKVIEGTNGQLVWLTSWSDAPDMLYSVSDDNGATWSETKHIEELVVTCSSSGIVRDMYAEEQTYYMVMVFNSQILKDRGELVMPRSRLGLFRSHDGINWEYLMDVDRWEDTTLYPTYTIHHYVNPTITVTEDYIYVGSGRSDSAKLNTRLHNDQSSMFLRIDKDKLSAYEVWPTVY